MRYSKERTSFYLKRFDAICLHQLMYTKVSLYIHIKRQDLFEIYLSN